MPADPTTALDPMAFKPESSPEAAQAGLDLYVTGVVAVTAVPGYADFEPIQHVQDMLCDLARALKLTDSDMDDVALAAILAKLDT